MRTDSVGLFWQDVPTDGRGGAVREMPKIPKTRWKTPREFPNLASAKILAVDTETYDPELKTHGPGWAREVGHLVGVSIATADNHAWYFPMRHTVKPDQNMDPKKVLAWLKDSICVAGVPKIGANIQYDIGWLRYEGVPIAGPFIDVLHAEALIDENQFVYDLNSVAKKYLGYGKVSNKLYRWLARFYGGVPDPKQRANIYRAPASLVGPYAEGDALQPFAIFKKQAKILKKEKLSKVFDIEERLIPLMLDMRKRGVRVDLDQAERANSQLAKRERTVSKQIKKMVGKEVNINASASIEKAFKTLNLTYPLTDKGNPSFRKEFLQNHPHPLCNLIISKRQILKARSTFIQNYILDKNHKGRLYCEFPQLKGSGSGTASGRFSSRNPNLQNVPSRDELSKLLIRSCFVPDLGYDLWGSVDLSQIEYRFLAHYAVGQAAKRLRKMYKKDPKTDFHAAIRILIIETVKITLSRSHTKNINFGLVYGMGIAKLARSLGLNPKAGKELMTSYHLAVPFVRDTFNYYMKLAQRAGVIKTILGRRSRFNLWEARDYSSPALPLKAARREYGACQLQRGYCHKALNRLLQGGAADYLKSAMLQLDEGGVFDALGGPPHLTVHDELDFSFNVRDEEPLKELLYVMNHAIKLRVPVLSVMSSGKNWGELKVYSDS